jgi:hypothetical protein
MNVNLKLKSNSRKTNILKNNFFYKKSKQNLNKDKDFVKNNKDKDDNNISNNKFKDNFSNKFISCFSDTISKNIINEYEYDRDFLINLKIKNKQ